MEHLRPLAGIIFPFLLFLYVLFTWSRRSVAHRKRIPPEAGGAWPVIGHLHLLHAGEPTHITLAKMADAYGPIFTFRFGMKKALIVSSWEIAKEFFTTNDRIFASRPKLVASKLLAYDYAMIGFSPYTPHWRQVRKIATLELLTNHRLEQLQHIRAFEVQRWMNELHKMSIKSNERGEKVAVEMKKWLADITLNTIFKMVIGKRFSAIQHGNENFPKALIDFFGLFHIFVPSDSFPFLSWLDLGGHEKTMKKTAKVIDEAFHKFLQQHRERRNDAEAETAEKDFMDVMISRVEEDGQHFSYDADTVIKATSLVSSIFSCSNQIWYGLMTFCSNWCRIWY